MEKLFQGEIKISKNKCRFRILKEIFQQMKHKFRKSKFKFRKKEKDYNN